MMGPLLAATCALAALVFWLVLRLQAVAARCAALEASLASAVSLTRDLQKRVEELSITVLAAEKRVADSGSEAAPRATVLALEAAVEKLRADVTKASTARQEVEAL